MNAVTDIVTKPHDYAIADISLAAWAAKKFVLPKPKCPA